MANLIWTGILYFSTLTIVYVVYRTFMNDRKAENERRTNGYRPSGRRPRKQEHLDAGYYAPSGRPAAGRHVAATR